MGLRTFLQRGRSYRFSGALQAAARNTTATVVARGVSMTATVVFTALFSRHVGVEGFGQYAYALSLATLLGGVCGFGLDSWAIREAVHTPAQSTRIIGHSLFVQALLSVLCLGGLAVYFAFVHRDPTMLAVSLIVGTYIFLDVSALLVISVFRAREVMAYEAIAVVAGNVAMLVFTVAGIAMHVGIRGLLLLVCASYGLKFAVIVWYAKTRCGLGSIWRELRPSAGAVRSGFPFLVMSVGNTLYGTYPRLMLAAFVTIPVVGLYAAAERVIALVAVVTGILDIIIYPIFTRRVQTSREAFARTYEQVTDFTLVVGLVIGLGVACLMPEIIFLLFGRGYERAVPIGMLLVPSISMATLGFVNSRAMLSLHKEKMMSVTIAATAGGGLAISLVLVHFFGAPGMAVTSLITSTAGFLLYFFYLRVKLGFPWITVRHLIYFTLFSAVFIVAYRIQTAGLLERVLVNGALLLVALPVFRAVRLLDWLRVFQITMVGKDSRVSVA
ncbi:MAG TPA: flippase [Thermoanaerobaculia bacterium]|nr:flippase [Thermoanaerobaculia bacterium]